MPIIWSCYLKPPQKVTTTTTNCLKEKKMIGNLKWNKRNEKVALKQPASVKQDKYSSRWHTFPGKLPKNLETYVIKNISRNIDGDCPWRITWS